MFPDACVLMHVSLPGQAGDAQHNHCQYVYLAGLLAIKPKRGFCMQMFVEMFHGRATYLNTLYQHALRIRKCAVWSAVATGMTGCPGIFDKARHNYKAIADDLVPLVKSAASELCMSVNKQDKLGELMDAFQRREDHATTSRYALRHLVLFCNYSYTRNISSILALLPGEKVLRCVLLTHHRSNLCIQRRRSRVSFRGCYCGVYVGVACCEVSFVCVTASHCTCNLCNCSHGSFSSIPLTELG